MGRGGAWRLMDFASTDEHFPGGLAYVNTLTCMLFGSISGSAAARGYVHQRFMLPEMKNKGYNNDSVCPLRLQPPQQGFLCRRATS